MFIKLNYWDQKVSYEFKFINKFGQEFHLILMKRIYINFRDLSLWQENVFQQIYRIDLLTKGDVKIGKQRIKASMNDKYLAQLQLNQVIQQIRNEKTQVLDKEELTGRLNYYQNQLSKGDKINNKSQNSKEQQQLQLIHQVSYYQMSLLEIFILKLQI